jgi:hypothetical protein
MRTDGQTRQTQKDRHDGANGRFSQFCKPAYEVTGDLRQLPHKMIHIFHTSPSVFMVNN